MRLTNEQIDVLKNNQIPMGLLSDALSTILNDSQQRYLEIFIGNQWRPAPTDSLCEDMTYRLRPDYEQPKEDGLVYCEITESAGDLCYMHPVFGDTFIDTALRRSDFVGGLYNYRSDGKNVSRVHVGKICPAMQQVEGIDFNWWSTAPMGTESKNIVYPTAVVLRRV